MSGAENPNRPETALVVGAGIVGATIAFRLAKAGLPVTILDGAGPSAGATRASWAWINAVAADTKSYFDLRQAAIAAHHDLEQELGDRLRIDWSGALVWDPELTAPDWNDRLAGWGHGGIVVDSKAARALEPSLAGAPDRVLHSPEDGFVHAIDMTEVLLEQAFDHGARLIQGEQVEGLVREGGRIVGARSMAREHRADVTVVALGIGTPDVLASVGLDLPMENPPGLIVETRPVSVRLKTAICTELHYIKQLPDGRLSIVDGSGTLASTDMARRLVEDTMRLLPGLGALTVERAIMRPRPIPADGKPVVGAPAGTAGLYVAVMHSGVTLAPLIGRLAEQEILSGAEAPLLEAFRLERFGLNP